METGTKLVLFPVKIPFYRENREDRDTAVPVTQCNELCIVTMPDTVVSDTDSAATANSCDSQAPSASDDSS